MFLLYMVLLDSSISGYSIILQPLVYGIVE